MREGLNASGLPACSSIFGLAADPAWGGWAGGPSPLVAESQVQPSGSYQNSCRLRQVSRPVLALAVLVILAVSTPVAAAPLPPVQPVSACGTVRLVHWLPPKVLPALPGMSGSAGRERRWPSRAVVVLGKVRGITHEQKRQINALLGTSDDGAGVSLRPGQLLLVLAGDDTGIVRPAARICVTDFTVSGDEGGTWTRHGQLRLARNDSGGR